MPRRLVPAVLVALLVLGGAAPALAAPALTPLTAPGPTPAAIPALTPLAAPVPTPAVPAPDTSSCPDRLAPGPPVDSSEQPAPGTTAPAPLPVPDPPLGGPRMGECEIVLPAGAPPLPADLTPSAWILADLDSGTVLAAKDPHGRYRPASLLKALTALVVCRELNMSTVVTGTQEDADQEGTRVGIGPGGRYTVRQLLTGLLLHSGNDVAHALARQLGGVSTTLATMNATARELGALDTRAATPSGLDGPGMSTSAYDLATIFRAAMAQPVFAETVRTEHAVLPGLPGQPPVDVDNDNKLLYDYPGGLGGKTGFTDDARHTFEFAAQRDGRRLVVVLLHGEQQPIPLWQQGARLLDYGFALPRDAAVGYLPGSPAAAAAGSTAPAGSAAGGGVTARPGSPTDRPAPVHLPTALLSVLVGLGAAGVLVGVLLVRRRRGARSSSQKPAGQGPVSREPVPIASRPSPPAWPPRRS